MGRPLKNKFFDPTGNESTGGEGVALTSGNVSFASITRGDGYFSANVGATVSAPQLTGGTTATVGTVYLFGNGAIKSVGLSNAGSGYTSAPTLTFTGANSNVATATVSINSAATTQNAILIYAWVAGGASSVVGDIVKQTGAKSFRVATAQGTSKCTLTTGSVAEGQCQITATKADASTFKVAKINGHTVTDASGNKFLWSVTAASSATTPETVNIGTN